MFSKKEENSTEKELEEIRDLVEINNKILLSQVRGKRMKIIFQAVIILGLLYLGYSLWIKNASKVEETITKVEDKVDTVTDTFEKLNSTLDKVLSIFGSDSDEDN